MTTEIKTTGKGQKVTFSEGSLFVDGVREWSGRTPLPLPASLKGKVPAGIEFLAGRVALTAAEASVLTAAIAAWDTKERAAYLATQVHHCERCKVEVDGSLTRRGSYKGTPTVETYCAHCHDILTVMGGQEQVDDRTPYHKGNE